MAGCGWQTSVYARGSKELVIVDDLTFQDYLTVRNALPKTQTFAMLVILRDNDWLKMTPKQWPDDIIVFQHFRPRHLLLLSEHSIGSYALIHLYSKQSINQILGLPLEKSLVQCGYQTTSARSQGHEGAFAVGTVSASEWSCALRSIANRVYATMGVSLDEYY